jgi:superfamily II DNA or RNA helicase
MSTNGMDTIPLRKWQIKALDIVLERYKSGERHALIAACPAAGKTRFTTEVATNRSAIKFDVIVVAVPTRALKRHWVRAFKRAGLGAKDFIPNEDLEQRRYRDEEMFDPDNPVQIYTYAQIAANPDLFRALCSRHKTLAVFDEIHHADDDAKYGQSLILAFEHAVFCLSLSGTPFNTKGGRLAFCNIEHVTNDQGRDITRTVVDFNYSYGEALTARGTLDDPFVVRPVQFEKWNGYAKWKSENLRTQVTTERRVDGSKESHPLWPLIEMQGDNAKKMIDCAIESLNAIRSVHANAGMLITAMDIDHCEQIVEYLYSRGIRDVTSINFDTPRAADAIDRWANSSERVLVAIKMISEGVDIVRLRVGVYMSKVLTRMFFIQFVGRFIRWDGSIDACQFAKVFIPYHVTLREYAEEIEAMVTEAEKQLIEDGPGGDEHWDVVRLDIESDGYHDGSIHRGETVSLDDEKYYGKLLETVGLTGKLSEGDVKRCVDAALATNPAFQRIQAMNTVMHESTLSKDNDRLVAAAVRVSQAKGRPMGFDEVQSYANKRVGIRAKDSMTTDAKLRERAEVLKQLLIKLRGYDSPTDA